MIASSLFGHPIEEWHEVLVEMQRLNMKSPSEVAMQLRSTPAELLAQRGKRLLAESKLKHIEEILRREQ